MTVGLREITEHAARREIDLLAEKSHVVAAREQAIKKCAGFGAAALQDVGLDEPETTRQKGTLPRRKSVAGFFGFITSQEFAGNQQFLFDCLHGAADPRVRCRKEAHQW